MPDGALDANALVLPPIWIGVSPDFGGSSPLAVGHPVHFAEPTLNGALTIRFTDIEFASCQLIRLSPRQQAKLRGRFAEDD